VTPCATCRQDVLHLAALDRAIGVLRIQVWHHPRLRGLLHRNLTAGRKARARYAAHLLEHRAAIAKLADHLTEHAEKRAA
jgi:hypothetical protein